MGRKLKKRWLFYVSLHSVKSGLILTSVVYLKSNYNRLGCLNETSFYSVEVTTLRTASNTRCLTRYNLYLRSLFGCSQGICNALWGFILSGRKYQKFSFFLSSRKSHIWCITFFRLFTEIFSVLALSFDKSPMETKPEFLFQSVKERTNCDTE